MTRQRMLLASSALATLATLATLASLVACAPGREQVDTAAGAVDTAAGAVDAAAAASTTRATKVVDSTESRSSTTARDTAHLGRDSAIKVNPHEPGRQLPTVPPKKPPI